MQDAMVTCAACWRQVPSSLRRAVAGAARRFKRALGEPARQAAADPLHRALQVARLSIDGAGAQLTFVVKVIAPPPGPPRALLAHPKAGTPIWEIPMGPQAQVRMRGQRVVFHHATVNGDGSLEIGERALPELW